MQGWVASETVLGEVSATGARDIVLATKFSKAMANDGSKQGASAALHHVRGRGEPEPG